MDFFAKDVALNHIDVKINVPRNIEVKADRSVLLQSLINLIKNSIYAIKDQDNPQIRIDFGFRRQVSQLLITDSGHMPFKIRKNAFKKNFTTKGKEGTGFGLYMIKSELEKMNFKIELEKGEPTCFRIEFPNESIGIKNNLV
jgi:two-component system sensor histidine kinase DctS